MFFRDLFKTLNRDDTPPEKVPTSSVTFKLPVTKQDQRHACEEYTKLKAVFRDIGRLNAIIEILGRDFLTAMPEGAYKSQIGQMAFLFRRMHEDLTSTETQKLLNAAKNHEYAHDDEWDEWDAANLREMEGMYRMFCHVNPKLMEKKARLAHEGRRRHSDILKTGDWEQARHFLWEQIDLHRRIADSRCSATEEQPHYQMLMQEFMPGMTVDRVDKLMGAHEAVLKRLLPEILEKQRGEPEPLRLEEEYGADAQMWLNRSLLDVIGFDFGRGGLYETGHNPVEGGTPEDTRLVISDVDTGNFLDSMRSALHEAGHGLYIQGLPRKSWRYQPVAMDMGAAVQESQALLIEMIIARTEAFFEFLSPRLEGLFHGMNNPAFAPENLFALKTRVEPTVYRRHADEVTYFHHVNMRYKLERDMINGKLKVEDLPEAWVEGMHDALGIYPTNHIEGCLQDVHWFVGKFGYFPSYALGHMMAAQLFDALYDDIDDIDTKIAEGEFGQIRQWLDDRIYSRGRLLNEKELLRAATGHKLRPEYLEKHLRKRYLS